MSDLKFEVVFKTAYGYKLEFTIQQWNEITSAWEAADISSFTTLQFIIERPDSTKVTKTAAFETDGTDGILSATLTEADNVFTQKGYYKVQGILATAIQYFPTSIYGFDVDTPL